MVLKRAKISLTSLLLIFVAVSLRPVCQAQEQRLLLAKPSQPSVPKVSPAAMILEYDRVLTVLHNGLKQQWRSRNDYLNHYSALNNRSSSPKRLTAAQSQVRSLLATYLRDPQPMDEGPPLGVEVQRAIENFEALRKPLLRQ